MPGARWMPPLPSGPWFPVQQWHFGWCGNVGVSYPNVELVTGLALSGHSVLEPHAVKQLLRAGP